jgi:hypothetical protein
VGDAYKCLLRLSVLHIINFLQDESEFTQIVLNYLFNGFSKVALELQMAFLKFPVECARTLFLKALKKSLYVSHAAS